MRLKVLFSAILSISALLYCTDPVAVNLNSKIDAVTVFADRAMVTACDVAVLDLEKPGSGAKAKLEAEIARALERGTEAIVLGCAGMADLAHELSVQFGVPVVDGVAAAVKQAEALAGLKLTTSRRGAYASPGVKRYTGLLEGFAPVPQD